ncbi:MAG: metal-sensing transcriptional repressor [Alphaproteobacteria bacterium]|nr:metal-sensing transcriptional repressor [Alphaproteobacteria bacterium]
MLHPSHRKSLHRLGRIEGQVRGVARMIEEDRYCVDILTQIRAIQAALARVEHQVLREHLEHCVENAIASGDADEQRKKIDELVAVLDHRR